VLAIAAYGWVGHDCMINKKSTLPPGVHCCMYCHPTLQSPHVAVASAPHKFIASPLSNLKRGCWGILTQGIVLATAACDGHALPVTAVCNGRPLPVKAAS
jgi:hypothetical protein